MSVCYGGKTAAPVVCRASSLQRLGQWHTCMHLDLHCATRNDFEKILAHGDNVFAPLPRATYVGVLRS
jgi:hypothetical protein